MSEVGDMWREIKEDARRHKDEQEPYRMARLEWLLERGDVILVRRLGEYGYRLIHYEWPQRRYVDFWPRTSAIRTHDGRSMKGWTKLLKLLGINPMEWIDRTPEPST